MSNSHVFRGNSLNPAGKRGNGGIENRGRREFLKLAPLLGGAVVAEGLARRFPTIDSFLQDAVRKGYAEFVGVKEGRRIEAKPKKAVASISERRVSHVEISRQVPKEFLPFLGATVAGSVLEGGMTRREFIRSLLMVAGAVMLASRANAEVSQLPENAFANERIAWNGKDLGPNESRARWANMGVYVKEGKIVIDLAEKSRSQGWKEMADTLEETLGIKFCNDYLSKNGAGEIKMRGDRSIVGDKGEILAPSFIAARGNAAVVMITKPRRDKKDFDVLMRGWSYKSRVASPRAAIDTWNPIGAHMFEGGEDVIMASPGWKSDMNFSVCEDLGIHKLGLPSVAVRVREKASQYGLKDSGKSNIEVYFTSSDSKNLVMYRLFGNVEDAAVVGGSIFDTICEVLGIVRFKEPQMVTGQEKWLAITDKTSEWLCLMEYDPNGKIWKARKSDLTKEYHYQPW